MTTSLPVIGLRQDRSGSILALALSPHQVLQLAKLVPQVRIGWRNGLRDGGIEIEDPGLGGSAEVSIAYKYFHDEVFDQKILLLS